jgi:hypothetical protein
MLPDIIFLVPDAATTMTLKVPGLAINNETARYFVGGHQNSFWK